MSSQVHPCLHESEAANPKDISERVRRRRGRGQKAAEPHPALAAGSEQPMPSKLNPKDDPNATQAQLDARYRELQIDRELEGAKFELVKNKLQIKNLEFKIEILQSRERLREAQSQAEWQDEQIEMFKARAENRIGDAELKAWILRQDPRRFE